MKIPSVYKPIFTYSGIFHFLRGGRGSGKSFAVADRILIEIAQNPNVSCVCLRETQKSIKFSSKKLLEERISAHGLQDYFQILNTEIRAKNGSGLIVFQSARDHTVESVKSMQGFSFVWLEEAHYVSDYTLHTIIPTFVRNGNPKMFFTWNPKYEDSPIEVFCREKEKKIEIFTTYLDIKSFVKDSLVDEAEEMQRKDPKNYQHVYLGDFFNSDGAIFSFVTVDEMPTAFDVQGIGIDWGFVDPSVVLDCRIRGDDLYIDELLHKSGLLTHEIAEHIPKETIAYADSAEPDRIEECKRHGKWVLPARKDVISGINAVKKYNIHITKRSKNTIKDFQNYMWKKDKADMELEIPNHEHSHSPDALRYFVYTSISKTKPTHTRKVDFL